MSLWYRMSVVSFFFFKQKTAYEMRISDWSSDVCSSDLPASGFPRHDLHECAAGPISSSVSRQASLSLLARTPPARSPSGIILISLFGAESDCMEYELEDRKSVV